MSLFECRRCGTGFDAKSMCHCSNCCRTFSGVTTFDMHLGDPSFPRANCKNPAAVRTQRGQSRMVCVAKDGVTGGMWRTPDSES